METKQIEKEGVMLERYLMLNHENDSRGEKLLQVLQSFDTDFTDHLEKDNSPMQEREPF